MHVFIDGRLAARGSRGAALEQAFGAHGLNPQITLLDPGMDLYSRAREAAEIPGTTLVAAGGDGTANALAAALVGTPGCLGVLPLGEPNRFAMRLRLPATLEEGVRAIALGSRRPVDVGEVNGRVFLSCASIGVAPRALLGALSGDEANVEWNKRWRQMLRAAGAPFTQQPLRVTVEEPALGGSGSPIPAVCTTPYLAVENCLLPGTDADRRGEWGSLSVLLAPGAACLSLLPGMGWKSGEGEAVKRLGLKKFTVELDRAFARVDLDGQIRRIEGPLRYRIRQRALHVLMPAL